MSFGGINRFRLWALAGVSAAAIVSPAWAQDAVKDFNIPAQEMTMALETFGKQSDTDVIFDRAKVSGRTSAALSGKLTPLEALTRLTTGSGLAVRRVNATSFIVEPSSFQTQSAVSEDETVEVVVTGSHIRNANPTSPVHLITRKDIDQSGYSQVGDLIRSLPENFSGGQNPGVLVAGSNIQNRNDTNSSTVNLRGLGTDATLVLVNGHRLAVDSAFQGSDISGIPLAAVSRIDIVPDGASAVYGSDAVAGVVNFVLRKDYDGGLASARLGTTAEGGGQEQTYSILQGVSRTKWHFLVNAEYSKQDAVTTGERDFTSSAVPVTTLLRPQERHSLFLNYGWNPSDKLKFGIDALFSDRTSQFTFQYTPDGARYGQQVYTPSYLVASSLEYSLSDSWKLRLTRTTAGSRDSAEYQTVFSGISYPSHSYYRNYSNSVELTADGTLFNLPSGELKAAVGAGYRDIGFRSGHVDNSSYLSKAENVRYVYGEIQAPLVSASDTRTGLHEIEMSISFRTEDYSTFGSTTTPKFGFRYKPFNSLTLRGTSGKSFKAPSFYQRYQPYYAYVYVAQAYGYSGGGQSVMLNGGNPNLKPERSEFSTIGADYSPAWIEGLKISGTYFNIDYKDRVINPISVLTSALSDQTYASFVKYFPSLEKQSGLIANAAGVYNFLTVPYDPSSVAALIDNRYTNATAQTVRGVDVSVRKVFMLRASTLSTFVNATQTRLVQKTVPAAAAVKLSGTIYNVPKLKARAGVTWLSGNWSVTTIVNHISPETDTGTTPNAQIGSWTTADTNFAYTLGASERLLKGVKIDLSASNLLDRKPPHARSPAALIPGVEFDSTNYSILGRQVSLTLSKAW